MGSGERVTAAVAMADKAGMVKVINLLSPDILSILYRGQGTNAASLIGMVSDSLKGYLKSHGDSRGWAPPVSGFYAEPMRDFIGRSAEDILDQVAGLHSSLYKARAPSKPERLPYHSDAEILRKVHDAAKKAIGIKADDIFTQRGMIEVKDGGRTRHLDIPIKTRNKVGCIMSAWYATPGTIETHFLRAQSNLQIASERGLYEPGLFISLPSGLEGHAHQMQIEDLVDNIHWRLQKIGYYLEVRETPEALAQEIINWAA